MLDRDFSGAPRSGICGPCFPAGEQGAHSPKWCMSIEKRDAQATLKSVSWMTASACQGAGQSSKADGIEDKIGYLRTGAIIPGVKITRDSYLGTSSRRPHSSSSAGLPRWQAVDRSEWTMTPPTINAYYDPQLNTINFPAGILQPPFFEKSMDDSVNTEPSAWSIGRTHSRLDDQGRKFDAHGNLRIGGPPRTPTV